MIAAASRARSMTMQNTSWVFQNAARPPARARGSAGEGELAVDERCAGRVGLAVVGARFRGRPGSRGADRRVRLRGCAWWCAARWGDGSAVAFGERPPGGRAGDGDGSSVDQMVVVGAQEDPGGDRGRPVVATGILLLSLIHISEPT